MKEHIIGLIESAIAELKNNGTLHADTDPRVSVENTKDKSHGDYASNVALALAKSAGKNPRELAQLICAALPASDKLEKTEIAGPGFINFFMNSDSCFEVLNTIFTQSDRFGHSDVGAGKKVQVEFVSANPTGPLHVGHGRGAAYGASVADLLEAAGYDVHREYYVNDAGRQMNILAASVWLRYLELHGAKFQFPSNGYKGGYVVEVAEALKAAFGDKFIHPIDVVFDNIPADEPQGGDKELHIDALIARCRELLTSEGYKQVFDQGLNDIVGDIRDDLAGFGVQYQQWFSEASLAEDVGRAIEKLQSAGHIYESEGALWFRSTDFGDDKDRVVCRDNGETTYFASDIAYHLNKFERGFEQVVNIWGADHHGYIARVKAALTALGIDENKLTVKLVQFAILYRGQERVQMSTRSGSFVTLRELREEVGNDAARFFYVTRKSEQHMDFDLELAKSESKDNPVYYIQYAHARICSVMRKLAEAEYQWTEKDGLAAIDALTLEQERDLATKLALYPEVLQAAAINHEPHQIANYLRELASDFHTYYNSNKVLVDEEAIRNARTALCMATKQVLLNGLKLLGVTAPSEM
jgi:arginyl-tRNA synthetase